MFKTLLLVNLVWLSLAGWCLSDEKNSGEPATAIFVMKSDGSQVRRVAEIKGFPDLHNPSWSHDSSQLAFDATSDSAAEQRIFLVELSAGLMRPLGPGAHPDWSPDDAQLVFDSGRQKIADSGSQGIWIQNVDGRKRLPLFEVGNAPRWSPPGGEIAALEGDSILIFSLLDSTQRKLDGIAGVLPGFDWSPEGDRLAYVARKGEALELWIADVADSAKKQKLLSGNLDSYLAWSPDGQRLAISLDGRIHLVNVDGSGEPQLVPDQQGVNRMPAWSSDGERLAFASSREKPALAASVSSDVPSEIRSVRLEEVRRHSRGAVVYGLDLTRDGKKALLGGKRDLNVWDLETGASEIVPLRGEWVAMSPDGSTIAQSGPLVKIALGDLNTGKPIRDLQVGTMCTNVRFSPDGKRVVTGTVDQQAQVYDVTTGKRICIFKNHDAPITRVAYLPNGKEAASNGQDEHLRIWNVETAEERLALKHPEVPWGLAVSPDGRLIATGTGGHTFDAPILHKMIKAKENVVRIWDATTGKLLRELPGHDDMIYSLIFSPDGRTVISGSWDATIRLWDVASGKELTSVKGQGSIYALAITPDGKHLVAGGGENRSAGQPIRRFRDEQVRLYRIVEE